MAELIATIILFGSVLGIGIIIWRKVPILIELPEAAEQTLKTPIWLKLKERIRNIPALKSFSFEIILQKTLSKVRILTLKIENKMALWLQKLREKSQKEKSEANDDYWEKLKKSTNQKDKKLPE